jgi:hypothetical protein
LKSALRDGFFKTHIDLFLDKKYSDLIYCSELLTFYLEPKTSFSQEMAKNKENVFFVNLILEFFPQLKSG